MRLHPVVSSLAIAAGAVSLAFLLAVASDRLLGANAFAASVVVAVVVGLLFALMPIEGLIGFGLAILLAPTVDGWFGLNLRYVDEVGISLFVLATIGVHRDRIQLSRPGVREGALGVLLISAAASSLANAVPAAVWLPGLGLLVKGVVFFYLMAALRIDHGELSRIVGAFFAVGLVIAIIGVVQFVSPELARDYLGVRIFGAQRGSIMVINAVFPHPALYGWLTVLMSLFLFARFSVTREWWAIGLAMALGAGTILSGRRIPVVGLIVGIVVAVARQMRSGRQWARTLVPAVLLTALLALISAPMLGNFYLGTLIEYGEPPDRIAEVFDENPDPVVLASMHPRNALYLGSLAIARDHVPLGAGVGRFGSHMSREEYSPVYAAYGLDAVQGLQPETPIAVTDTFWPMILGETGAVGLLAAVAFFALLGRDLWRAAGLATQPALRAFALGALLVFVEGLVRSLISAVFVAPPIAYFVLGAAGLSLAVTRDATDTTGEV